MLASGRSCSCNRTVCLLMCGEEEKPGRQQGAVYIRRRHEIRKEQKKTRIGEEELVGRSWYVLRYTASAGGKYLEVVCSLRTKLVRFLPLASVTATIKLYHSPKDLAQTLDRNGRPTGA